ncbi:MAG: aconitate hydratase AcnA [bacterium]|jgi:aconitate hydratase|nr:aconitate hydratase AcnA [Betaproteobacteria bacterium]
MTPAVSPQDAIALRRVLPVDGVDHDYFSLADAASLGLAGVDRLPFTIKVFVESLIRQRALGRSGPEDLASLAQWLHARGKDGKGDQGDRQHRDCEIGFRPARMMMPDSSGITLLGDMAAMRDAMVDLGGDPRRINPQIQLDFIVDHSVMVEAQGRPDALVFNMQREFEQNRERYEFLRWGSRAFGNLRVFPPGSGILHQINLEYLASVVFTAEVDGRRLAYPDSLIAMDSHTAMTNALGVVGWGVGGLEGGTVALGEPISILVPEVVGCRLVGRLPAGTTATDLALTVTQAMRRHGVIAKVVEFFGPGVDTLMLPERATLSNMTPEYGANMGFFPVDAETLRYLALTGRTPSQVALVEAYCRAQGLWRDSAGTAPDYAQVVEVDLSAVEPVMAGPGRPDARVPLAQVPAAFAAAAAPAAADASARVPLPGMEDTLGDGDVAIAAITSCTNTSNPMVMIAAGLLARNARRRGLTVSPRVKTSLSPGSRVVADYLARSGLQEDLDALGFQVAGFGCMTCMGNSGPLAEPVLAAIDEAKLATVAVLSGNRNFDARIHPAVRANFLASPPLVVACAIAGTIVRDLTCEPLGTDPEGRPVFLREIWPGTDEVRAVLDRTLDADLFRARYASILDGSPQWQSLVAPDTPRHAWRDGSHFIIRPPFFEGLPPAPPPVRPLHGARALLMLGDMVTTDHISPIGAIPASGPAGRYLQSLGVAPKDFVNYAARRLNHEVMVRGTFANLRLRNELTPGVEGSSTVHVPSGQAMSVHEASERYRADGIPLVVVAGREYGAGSSRDWAAKGTALLGVRAVIAESFERIHRSNLVGMGVLPLQFPAGTTRRTLGLTGHESFDVDTVAAAQGTKADVACTIVRADGSRIPITLTARLDTRLEVDYYRHGGIVQHVLRKFLEETPR